MMLTPSDVILVFDLNTLIVLIDNITSGALHHLSLTGNFTALIEFSARDPFIFSISAHDIRIRTIISPKSDNVLSGLPVCITNGRARPAALSAQAPSVPLG
jgi:hypothetical protein